MNLPPPATIGYVQYMETDATPQSVPPATQQTDANSAAYRNTFTGGWFGLRTDLARYGVSFNGYGVTDNSWNLLGGKSTHDFVSRACLTLGMNLDTDKLFSWPGGTIVSSVRFHFAANGNDIQLGSLQGFSYIDDSPPETQLYELYYKQALFNNILLLQAGRMDANNIFDIPVDATDLVNPSASDAPLTLQNAPPAQAPGLVAFVTAKPGSTLILGAFFNGRSHPTALDAMLDTLGTIEEPDGTSLNFEFDQNYKLADNMPGTLGAGGFWRTGRLPTLDGGVQSGTGGWMGIRGPDALAGD
jgi:carbohydrate-selective porin OprB